MLVSYAYFTAIGDTDRNRAPPESGPSVSAQGATPKSTPESSSEDRTAVSEQITESRQRTNANSGPAWLHIVFGFVGAAAVGAVGMWLLLRRRAA